MKPKVTLIAAMAQNRVIGRDNQLIWYLPEDLKHFKAKTMGHWVIMGRKTWESLPGVLAGRQFVVVTNNRDYRAEGATVVHSLQEALELCLDDPTPYIAGGAQLYAQALEVADAIELTLIRRYYEGDAFFPELDPTIWKEVKKESHHSERLECDYEFQTWERI